MTPDAISLKVFGWLGICAGTPLSVSRVGVQNNTQELSIHV